MQNVFLSLMLTCMYFSIFAVIIPVGFDTVYGLENTTTWKTRDDGFTINYPTGWLNDQGQRTASGEYRYVISFFNPEDTAQITITRIYYPEMIVTMDFFYDIVDNPEKYGQTIDQNLTEHYFSGFILMELTELLNCGYYNIEEDGCIDFKLKAIRLFENDDGLPALQAEYSYAEKTLGDNITYEYSVLLTKYYLQDRPIVVFSDSLLNDYDDLRPYFVEAANSFTINADSEAKKLSDKTKSRLLSDMKSFVNSDDVKILKDSYKQGSSVPIIEYGEISLDTLQPKLISKELGIAAFVDQKKDPQSYVDRYNNEPTYKKWFDSNFPEHSSIYEAVGIPTPIPEWVRTVFGFWANGDISDVELTSAVAFLIDNEIIKVSLIHELQKEISQLKKENSDLRTKLNLSKPAPEPIPQQESKISVQTDDSNKNEIGIDSDSPLLPNISIANPRIVNAFGSEIDTVNVYQQIQVVADITNYNYFYQSFTFHMIIRETGYEEWFSGQFSGNQSFSPAVTWTPSKAGIFTAELSVFDNLQNKNKLTDSITLQIRVS
ncbi:MAG: hypothetical protein IIA83_00365 [Thaumarchaeota archaeon]|nr:hypothetical protein [Nitrososphaerota archaeon]